MRPGILLASFLAVLPFVSATPSPAELARKVLPRDPKFVPQFTVENGPTYDFLGCYDVSIIGVPETNLDTLTVENCISACYQDSDGPYKYAGVGNKSCRCGRSHADSPMTGSDECKAQTCKGNNQEYCGSSTRLVLYGNLNSH